MASAKKQEHLEAGKRRLEEFRKKKAADRAKKSTNYLYSNPDDQKQPVAYQNEIHTDTNGELTSDRVSESVLKPSQVLNDKKSADFSDTHHNLIYDSTLSREITQTLIENKEIDRYARPWSSRIGSTNLPSSSYEKNDDYNEPRYGHLNPAFSKAVDTDFTFASPDTSTDVGANVSRENTSGIKPGNEDSADSTTKIDASFSQVWQNSNSSISSVGERKLNDYFSNLPTSNSTATTGLYSPETSSKRSRPSFLDSINLSGVEPRKKDELFSPKIHDSSAFAKSSTEIESFQYGANAFDKSTVSSVSTGNGNDVYGGGNINSRVERESFFNSRKHDEDFAALEQHIEDLTQEKFSLQRALEASRTLADSLAAENSSLTESYNQQGSIMNQLKSDMEVLQGEIRADLVELEAVKMEYSNAQLECTAADERASMLASEVISLEEKALKLRSSELKLERQLENSLAEFSSLKRKLSSLEKDRQDLQSTIDALQEEKKLLQTMLHKSSASRKSFDAGKSLDNKKDASTSTQDLIHEDKTDAAAVRSNLERDNDSILHENGKFDVEFASSSIPSDQFRMIQNINTLLSELAMEKEELTQALLTESSESSKLKGLNKELSRKLEVQTQRLELLTAQNMANENIPIKQQDPRNVLIDNTPYADEGDEVVERVLGWIMKLFPGGPSRRRNGKHI